MRVRALLLSLPLAAVLAAAEPAARAPGSPVAAPPRPGVAAMLFPPRAEPPLWIDATAKEVKAKPGEVEALFTFQLRNTSAGEVVIRQVRTSCGCTVAQLPSQPWTLTPGAAGSFTVVIDLRGRSGVLVKMAEIDTPQGTKPLTLKVTIPGPAGDSAMGVLARVNNAKLAAADRQAVFKGDCATCHAGPTAGQFGAGLYLTACAICHDAEHRASFVPDLHALAHPTDREFWRQTIAEGKPGTLMPAFAVAQGGPLRPEQIETLVNYLSAAMPPPPAPAVRP